MSMWGGRFEGETDALFREFNDSLPIDRRLLPHDIRGSIAWAHALVGAGVLTGDECARMAPRRGCALLEEREAAEPLGGHEPDGSRAPGNGSATSAFTALSIDFTMI